MRVPAREWFRRHRLLRFIALAPLAVLLLTACAEDHKATPSSLCAFVVGDGQNGHNAKVHQVVGPDTKINYDSGSEVVRYVPCNSRNYLVNQGDQVNVNGRKIGDRFTPSLARTSTGTKVKVWYNVYWTLNQGRQAMEQFYQLCLKYECYSTQPKSGGVNFGEAGWGGMLGETFNPALDRAAFDALSTLPDSIWETPTSDLLKKAGTLMSQSFAEEVRVRTGYNQDLFCGSGNSFWNKDHTNFTCSDVRIEVSDVEPESKDVAQQSNETIKANQDKALNEKRLAAAVELYGSKEAAGYWLGIQDSIDKCNADKAQVTCVISIGGNAPTVSVPGK